MMTDAEKRLMTDLELLYNKWSREWVEHVSNDAHPTIEDERVHLLELKKIITDHWRFDPVRIEGYLK